MIVRNESQVIRRALRSAKPHIDYWVICDTGSDDGTQGIIMNEMHSIPGELHAETWRDFGYNRTQCIQYAFGKSDYILIMDADMTVHVKSPFKEQLVADSYNIHYEGDLDYTQPMLIANRHQWHFEGVTHEYIKSSTAQTAASLPQLTLEHYCDGSNRSDKFHRDIRLLNEEWKQDSENPRTAFYLAQSYSNLDMYTEALEWYERRVSLQGWPEETWFSQMQIGRMQLQLNLPVEEVQKSLLKAFEMRPFRLEPVYLLAKYYRENGQFALGYLYAQVIQNNPGYPGDALFIERAVYQYLLHLELGVCAYALHRKNQAIRAFNKVLEAEKLPAWARESALRGLQKCHSTSGQTALI